MNYETRQVLIKVLIGITDYALRANPSLFDDNTINYLLKTTFDVFVQTGIQDVQLLSKYLSFWASNNNTLIHWLRTSKTLFKELIYILYNLIKSKPIIKEISKLDSTYVNVNCPILSSAKKKMPVLPNIFNLSNDHVVFLFFNFGTIFERVKHKWKVDNKKIRKAYDDYLVNLIQEFYGVNKLEYLNQVEELNLNDITQPNIEGPVPTFNKDYVNEMNTVLQSKGKSIIIGKVLLDFFEVKIFKGNFSLLAKFLTNFPGPYTYLELAYFYKIMRTSLVDLRQNPDEKRLVEYLQSSIRLFASNLYGIHILLPEYLGLDEVIMKYNKNTQVTELYSTILFYMLVFISTIAPYNAKVLFLQTNEHLPTALKDLISLKQDHFKYLKNAMKKSNNSFREYCLLLWVNALISIITRGANISGFIKKNFAVKFYGEWTEGSVMIMLSCLEIVETIIESIKEVNEQWNKQLFKVIQLLLKYIEENATSLKLIKKSRVIKEFDCVIYTMIRIIMIAMNARSVSNEKIIIAIKSVIDKCKEAEKKTQKKSETAIELLELSLTLLTVTKRFNSSVIKFSVFSNEESKVHKPQFNFLVNNQIITMTQLPRSKGDYSMVMEIRDVNEHYIYRGEMITSMETFNSHLEVKDSRSKSLDWTPGALLEECKENKAFVEMSNERAIAKEIHKSKVFDLLKAESINEGKYLRQKEEVKEDMVSSKSSLERFKLKSRDPKSLAIRMFLKHFKPFLNERPKLLKNNEDLYKYIKELDSIEFKKTLFVPLLYIADPCDTTYAVNTPPDPFFNTFINSLGVRLKESHMRTGNYNKTNDISKYVGIIHASTYFTDIAFLCPSLHFDREVPLINSSKVLVLWNARQTHSQNSMIPAYLSNPFTISESRIAIVITPIHNDLYRINIFTLLNNTPTSSISLNNK